MVLHRPFEPTRQTGKVPRAKTNFRDFGVNRELRLRAILLASRNFRQYVEITDIKIFIGRVRNQIESQSRSAITRR